MKKKLLKLSSIALFVGLSFTTTFADSIELKDEQKRNISQPTNVESIQVKDEGELTISSTTLTVKGGSKDIVDLKDEALTTVSENGTLIIYGNVIIKGEAQLKIYGRVIIYGNLQLKDEAEIVGTGQLVVTGDIERKDESIITGVKVSKDAAVITSINEQLSIELASGEKATIAIYNTNGQLLSTVENSESAKIDLNQINANPFEVLIVRVSVGDKVYSSKIVKM